MRLPPKITQKLKAGGVKAEIGTPAYEPEDLPAAKAEIGYLVSAKLADKVAGRSDCYKLPINASADAPAAIRLNYLIKV